MKEDQWNQKKKYMAQKRVTELGFKKGMAERIHTESGR